MVDLTGKRILVAGGTGTVGQFLVDALLEAGATVVVPSRTHARRDELTAQTDPRYRERLVTFVGDISDEADGERVIAEAGDIDGAIASIGHWVSSPDLLGAKRSDLAKALAYYTLAHFSTAKVLLPAVEKRGGAYIMITGSLSYEPDAPGTGLVAIAGAAQSMLGRVLMKERKGRGARINEIVIYSSFGRGNDAANEVKGADVGRYAAYLLSDAGSSVKDQAIHLRSRQDLAPL